MVKLGNPRKRRNEYLLDVKVQRRRGRLRQSRQVAFVRGGRAVVMVTFLAGYGHLPACAKYHGGQIDL